MFLLKVIVAQSVSAVRVPFILAILGVVSVLFVRVSVVARPTRVSVDVGSVSVPVFDMVDIIGLVRVFPVRVSVAFLRTRVSLAPVGRVRVPPDTFIAAILGVVIAGEFENTRTHPLPVSSLMTHAS